MIKSLFISGWRLDFKTVGVKRIIRNAYFRIVLPLYVNKKLNSTVTEKIGHYSFTVYPTVFNPVDFTSSRLFADFILEIGKENRFTGKHVLDMGCGSGVISVFAASAGAECTAADINPMAVCAAKENAEANGFGDKITAVESDLFEAFKANKYDFIFFNPPYYKGKPKNNFERAFKAGNNLEVISDFLRQAANHLNPEGVIYFIVSSDMNLKELEDMFIGNTLSFKIVKEIKKFFETFYIIESVR
jgi:release factor glutamine methyltransferase